MFGQVPGVDQDIVHVYDDKSVEELPEHLIHEPWMMDEEFERPSSIIWYS